MREVFGSNDFTEVGYYKSILDEAGIACFVGNQNATVMIGGAIAFPSLYVVNDADYDEAIRVLKSGQSEVPAGTVEWTCPSCSQKNPANFELCWNCKTARPAA